MPQDELWAASARLVGYTVGVGFTTDPYGDHVVHITPRYSKTPASKRNGATAVAIGTDMADYIPALIETAHFEMTGGLASNVPGVVRAKLQMIREGFHQGSLH